MIIKIANLEFHEPALLPEYLKRLTDTSVPNYRHVETDREVYGRVLTINERPTLIAWSMCLTTPEVVDELAKKDLSADYYNASSDGVEESYTNQRQIALSVTRTLVVWEVLLEEGETTPSGWEVIESEIEKDA